MSAISNLLLSFPSPARSYSCRRCSKQLRAALNLRCRLFSENAKLVNLNFLFKSSTLRITSVHRNGAGNDEAANSINTSDEHGKPDIKVKGNTTGSSFLAKLAIVLGIAATITILHVLLKQPSEGSSFGTQFLVESLSSSTLAAPAAGGFSFKAFGYRVVIPAYAPGWVYFWLLMAAGCGLFISEEALNIWVGISLARLLTLDGTWKSLGDSLSKNSPYIVSTVLWVYWGVCISDMIPFYLGKLFKRSGASEDVYSKLGIGKEKATNIMNVVQRYGNLIGFGHITRLFLCWCVLWGINNSSDSVGYWFLTERASGFCSCNRCYHSGNLDNISICSGCINSCLLLSSEPLLELARSGRQIFCTVKS